MVEFLYSLSGEMLRASLLERAAKTLQEERKAYFIVPEQLALAYEEEVGRNLPPNAPLSLTVASFSLLADIASRRFGCLSYKKLSKPQKVLFMWKAIREMLPSLQVYGRCAPDSLTPRMLECINELKGAGVSPEDLLDASYNLENTPSFAKKLSDISLVYSAYTALTKNKYSDANDELSKLLGFLAENDMFHGCDVFIDSFTDFTPLQMSIIRYMIRDAENVYISFPADPTTDDSIQFECIKDTFFGLCALCDRHGKDYSIRCAGQKDSRSGVLACLSSDLITFSPVHFSGEHQKNERVEAYSCKDTQEEICACINLIRRAVYEGYSFGDIAVLARRPEKYEKMLAISAADADISFFSADKRKISEGNFAVYILSLLRIISRGWKRSDVIAHLKSGLCKFSADDINRFIMYTERWDIDGQKQFCDRDFSASYSRFSGEGDPDDRFIIASNLIKNELFPKINEFGERLVRTSTIREMLTCLFEYLEESGASEVLREVSERIAQQGDVKTAQINSGIYTAVMRLFDDIAYSIGEDEAIPIRDFSEMLELLMSSAEIGSIPTRKDEVILADASLYRSFGHKIVIMLGMSEGDFPMPIKPSGLISESEKGILQSEGLAIAPTALTSASKEYFFLWRAVSTAKEQLYMTYARKVSGEGEKLPGMAVRNIATILGKSSVRDFSDCIPELLYAPSAFFSGLSLQDKDDPFIKEAYEFCLERKKAGIGFIRAHDPNDYEPSLNEETASSLFSFPITVSPTSLEAYNKCAFAYFCSRLLKLDDGRKNEFTALISGTLVHTVLEKYLSSGAKYSAEETDEICSRISDEYYDAICPEHLRSSERIKLNFIRAAVNASLLARFAGRDIENSGFTPTDFEKNVAYSISGENGEELRLRGRVDRIDKAVSDGEEFARIIDYKTGNKRFSVDALSEGLDLQLPLYLSALTHGGDDILPGGFMYLSSAVPRYDVSAAEELCDKEALSESIVSSVDASGVLNSLFAPKKGSKIKAMSDEEIKRLLTLAEDTAMNTVKRMRRGDISPTPKKSNGLYPCEYCPYAAVCRKKRSSD